MDQERINRLRDALDEAHLAAIVLRLPENTVMATGHWPMNGMSYALLTAAQGPVALLAPTCEEKEVDDCWTEDVRLYAWPRLDMDDPLAFIKTNLEQLADQHGLNEARIGYEGSFDAVAPAHNAGEVVVPNESSIRFLKSILPNATWDDATDLLHQQRATKTAHEVERLRIAHHVAGFGLDVFHQVVKPGMSEAAIASAVYQATLEQGVEVEGVRHINVYPQVSVGENAFRAWRPVVTTGPRKIRAGEIALLEMAVCVDGYWADVTRVKAAGEPMQPLRNVFDTVLRAQQAALDSIRAGVQAQKPHEEATEVLIDAGYEKNLVHLTGHGVGFRYHEPEPFLMPSNSMTLRAGHVCTVEPGLYDSIWGGIRLEDNVVVTADGIENLTTTIKTL